MNYTKNDSFDSRGYEDSIWKVEAFCERYNSTHPNHKAIPLDSQDRFAADVVIQKKVEEVWTNNTFVELESGPMYSDVLIWARRLKKSYTLPCFFIRHDMKTNECIACDIEVLKVECAKRTPDIDDKVRHTPNGIFHDEKFRLPKSLFKVFWVKDRTIEKLIEKIQKGIR